MIKRILIILLGALLLLGIIYGAWRWSMGDDVARIQATVDYHNKQIQTINRATQLKVNRVHAIGFPFHSRVRIEQPTLSYVFGDETYKVMLDYADFTARDSGQGSYTVDYPNLIQALYAKSGGTPENYTVTIDNHINLLMRAQGDSQQCSGFPGAARCPDAAATAPLITIAPQLPASITLTMTLNGQSKQAGFTLQPVAIPIYQTIPADLQSPLELFINVLREAMVFQGK